MKILLRKDSTIRDDPGPPLNKPYATITIETASEIFVFNGEGNTARKKLDIVRSGKATPKDRRCNQAIKAGGGAVAMIRFPEDKA